GNLRRASARRPLARLLAAARRWTAAPSPGRAARRSGAGAALAREALGGSALFRGAFLSAVRRQRREHRAVGPRRGLQRRSGAVPAPVHHARDPRVRLYEPSAQAPPRANLTAVSAALEPGAFWQRASPGPSGHPGAG